MSLKVPAGPLKSFNSISAIEHKSTFLFETVSPVLVAMDDREEEVSCGAMMRENKLSDVGAPGHP